MADSVLFASPPRHRGARPGNPSSKMMDARVDGITILWTFFLQRPQRSWRKLFSPCGPEGSFIDMQSKAWAFRQRDVPVDRSKRIWTKAPAQFLERQKIFGDDE